MAATIDALRALQSTRVVGSDPPERDPRSEQHSTPVRVLLVEPFAASRCGLEVMLGALPFVDLVGSVDCEEAVSANLADGQIDVLIIGSETARETIEKLRAGCGALVRVLVLVRSTDEAHLAATARLGAHGFLVETELTIAHLEAALRLLAEGDMPLPVTVARHLLQLAGRHERPTAPDLTARESQVLALLADGLSNKEIARRLGISTQSAKRYVSFVLAKLNCSNRTLAAARAIREGLVPTEHPAAE